MVQENFPINIPTKLLIQLLVLIVACWPVTSSASSQTALSDPDHPNILMIIVDDLNDWVGVYNAHPNAITPNMDRLAIKGTLFTNAHAAAPLCGPTRAALLSGLRPSTTGLYGHPNQSDLKNNPQTASVTFLPDYFSKHGYVTLSTGKVYHTGSPAEAFDITGVEQRDFGPYPEERMSYTPPEGHGTSTDWGPFPESDHLMPDYKYAHWAVEQLQRNFDQPFFMSVGFVRPHVPWHVPQKWFDMHPIDGIMLPLHNEKQFDDVPETALQFSYQERMPSMDFMRVGNRWRENVQAYLASITFVDHYIGLVLDALEKSIHAENTIIVLFSDHGHHLGEKGIWAKHTLWEESTRIPMIISRPGDTGFNRTHKPVNHLDVYPTLLDLANLPPYSKNEGKSLLPLLDNPDAVGFDASLTTHGYRNHTVRTERWRYIRYEDGAEELYDHWADPNEWKNLAVHSQYADVIKNLRKHLPETDALWDANVSRGSHYNQYMRDLFERSRNDR